MKPGPDCVVAKRMVGDQFSKVPAPRAPEPAAEGVWITFELTHDGPQEATPHPDELTALRALNAGEYTRRAKFIKYGEAL